MTKKNLKTSDRRRPRRRGRKRRKSFHLQDAFSSALIHVPEPELTFACDQAIIDPRDGLMLFGPLERDLPYGVRVGVIGTAMGIEYFKGWLSRIQGIIHDDKTGPARPPYLGFETIFRIPLAPEPTLEIELDSECINATIRIEDKHQRVYQAVGLFTDAINKAHLEDDKKVDVWFVVIPDDVHKYCRPRSLVPKSIRIDSDNAISPRKAKALYNAPSLFEEDNKGATPYHYEVDFHNQLKARMLEKQILTQIIRESTIAIDGKAGIDRPKRDNSKYQAATAWALSTAAFYKAGGKPWRLDGVREGVCYIGLVFKQDHTQTDPRMACCAAQMFLDSGDGTVFRGTLGPWYNPALDECHLNKATAESLIRRALEAYKGTPRELFIHGKVQFSDEEWDGFRAAIDPSQTSLVGVRIRDESSFRLFRPASTRPVLRGLAYLIHDRAAYLWTKGFAPRIKSYAGRQVPKPLRIDVLRGEADMNIVLRDILALTKLNYNACLLGDGLPVTLRFANAIGEILTAAPETATAKPLPFRHYI